MLRGSFSGNDKLIGFRDQTLPHKARLWTFLVREDPNASVRTRLGIVTRQRYLPWITRGID